MIYAHYTYAKDNISRLRLLLYGNRQVAGRVESKSVLILKFNSYNIEINGYTFT